ncbi:MFS transporter [Bradyrhizobium sp. AUGA SZCCT0051]|nr:MFS transporter [Bradyrhizobium sp. AUGA SZCCT0124]MBR1311898.1 MFS transporter [Bradyrhizobium sp. AUGA SZCCT0051]MBR1343628.1 MFS transporter [Bradyrhizobium sp. AUGA SZCCT0105]MBR1358169.1 MFS transporter [Bradyrhizobium sp. AUGA SZCCT0045]
MDDMLRRKPFAMRASQRLTLLTLCLAVTIAHIDTFIVNLGARAIGNHFGAGVDELQWIVDSYNLVYAVSLLTGGMLADRYGRRRILICGALIFTFASLLCAAAPSALVLIGGRALTGAGGALMIPARLRSSGWSGTGRRSAPVRLVSGPPATASPWHWDRALAGC